MWLTVLMDKNVPMIPDGTQHLIVAILTRAVRDLNNANPTIRAEARLWLVADPLCAEICDILGYSLPELHQAVGLHDHGANDRANTLHEVD